MNFRCELNFEFYLKAISPGLVESDILTENANDELVSIMPALSAKDVSFRVRLEIA